MKFILLNSLVVVSVEAAAAVGDGALFDDRVILIGVLGGVALALTFAILMLRRSQMYPSEKADDPEDVDDSPANLRPRALRTRSRRHLHRSGRRGCHLRRSVPRRS